MATAAVKRYKLSEILEVTDTYRASPGGTEFASLGQVVFALDCCRGGTGWCLGQCTCGCVLVPWGICCIMYASSSSACTCATCVSCGFTLGSASSIFVALGAINGCGATLWRRIS
jgi:hypothetical protein